MKKLYIVGNWKSNKTESETISWFQRLMINDLRFTNKEIIVCPSFTMLPILKSLIINHKSSIKLGAQDISPFEDGPYTGEVNGKQIKEFADYVIIGHSERRSHFGEEEGMVNKKLEMGFKYGLIPILCVSDTTQLQTINHEPITNNLIVAYEPLFAIGTGSPDTPENADSIAFTIKKELGNVLALYGGSVKETNVNSFTSKSNIDGILVGGASLDPKEFVNIIHNA